MIVQLLEGYLSSASSVTEATIASYVAATEEYELEALRQACQRFNKGDVPGHNNAFPPSAPELAEQARLFDGILKNLRAKDVPLYSGLTEIDYGSGRIDMRGLTVAEQDRIMRLGGRAPDGRSLAGMGLADIREALKAEPVAIAGAPAAPKLQRMTDG